MSFDLNGKIDKYDMQFIERVHSYPNVRLIHEHPYSYGLSDEYGRPKYRLASIWVYYDGGYEVYYADQKSSYRIMLEL